MVMSGAYDPGGDAAGEVREAFRRWASTTSAAPARLEEQITAVVERDEVITRLATTVTRRDLVQRQGPFGRSTGRATDPRSIDPFAVTLNDLRARTEHPANCPTCGGARQTACGGCGGSGRARCRECGGDGHITRYYKKSSRVIQCPTCRTKGTVACSSCGSSGRVTCGPCQGSGQVLLWWGWDENVTTKVRFSVDSPVLVAYGALRAERMLTPPDLAPFTVQAVFDSPTMLTAQQLGPGDPALHWQPMLNPQSERVTAQQYARFGVRRRDVSYELCGTVGTVALSGLQLAGAATPEALRPLQRRRTLWVVLGLVSLFVWFAYAWAWVRMPVYFVAVNRTLMWMALVGFVGATMAVGGVLRTWRASGPRWPLRGGEKAGLALAAVALLACPVLWAAVRPSEAEARSALGRQDHARARVVAEALFETAPSPRATAVLDEIDLADARRLTGDARLARLDAVSARRGSMAAQARNSAERQRLDEVRASFAARDADGMLAKLDRWALALAGNADAAELRAAAHDIRRRACATDVCRYGALRAARAAHRSPERDGAWATVRATLLAVLNARTAVGPDASATVRALRQLSAQAAEVGAPTDDPEMTAAAAAASAWATEQRSHVPLLGVEVAAVDDLLERPAGSTSATGWSELAGVSVYTAASDGRSVGLYVVGATAGARTLRHSEVGLRRLLVQATGQPGAAVPARPAMETGLYAVVEWREGDTPVVGRWSGDNLMELRIGQAEPAPGGASGGRRRGRHGG